MPANHARVLLLNAARDAKIATDPLTSKGNEIMSAMKDQYGGKKGESVFYASKNKGTIGGVDYSALDVFLMEGGMSKDDCAAAHDILEAVGEGPDKAEDEGEGEDAWSDAARKAAAEARKSRAASGAKRSEPGGAYHHTNEKGETVSEHSGSHGRGGFTSVRPSKESLKPEHRKYYGYSDKD
jgi:hypothetical protein